MAYDYFSPDGNAGREPISRHWIIEGTMVPIYLDGELIKTVPVCWEYCNIQGTEYEISDVRYGSIDGVILPHWDDIVSSIQEKMGLRETLIFPDKFNLDLKL